MIPLFVQNGVAYVWNSEDWYCIRSQHRVCGSLIGSVPSFPRQNEFQGLPMALMPEEAALLVEKGYAELFELPNILEEASLELKQEINAMEQRIFMEQSDEFRKRKIEQISQKIDIIAAGKRKKMILKGMPDIPMDKQALLQEEISKLPPLAPVHALVHIPTEHFLSTERKKVTTEALKPSLLDRKGIIRYSIYKDLWEKGYFITSGIKFGSDYLVYPADPVRFHATYMIRCIYDQNKEFRPQEIVAFGRLSVAVNKLAVLAFVNGCGLIEYQTLKWHDSPL